ncbi:Uncharacterized protein HZ326_8073 [Fusarium oxysporum f. sp. albedinis]|nr:Uncharacterized protein HZ326_8073 [Fusarium oxysporum f. sp. albedinis]
MQYAMGFHHLGQYLPPAVTSIARTPYPSCSCLVDGPCYGSGNPSPGLLAPSKRRRRIGRTPRQPLGMDSSLSISAAQSIKQLLDAHEHKHNHEHEPQRYGEVNRCTNNAATPLPCVDQLTQSTTIFCCLDSDQLRNSDLWSRHL